MIKGGDSLGSLRESVENVQTTFEMAKALSHYIDFLADQELHLKEFDSILSYNFFIDMLQDDPQAGYESKARDPKMWKHLAMQLKTLDEKKYKRGMEHDSQSGNKYDKSSLAQLDDHFMAMQKKLEDDHGMGKG